MKIAASIFLNLLLNKTYKTTISWMTYSVSKSSGICGQRWPRSAYASMQSNQDLRCPPAESLDIKNVSLESNYSDETLLICRMI